MTSEHNERNDSVESEVQRRFRLFVPKAWRIARDEFATCWKLSLGDELKIKECKFGVSTIEWKTQKKANGNDANVGKDIVPQMVKIFIPTVYHQQYPSQFIDKLCTKHKIINKDTINFMKSMLELLFSKSLFEQSIYYQHICANGRDNGLLPPNAFKRKNMINLFLKQYTQYCTSYNNFCQNLCLFCLKWIDPNSKDVQIANCIHNYHATSNDYSNNCKSTHYCHESCYTNAHSNNANEVHNNVGGIDDCNLYFNQIPDCKQLQSIGKRGYITACQNLIDWMIMVTEKVCQSLINGENNNNNSKYKISGIERHDNEKENGCLDARKTRNTMTTSKDSGNELITPTTLPTTRFSTRTRTTRTTKTTRTTTMHGADATVNGMCWDNYSNYPYYDNYGNYGNNSNIINNGSYGSVRGSKATQVMHQIQSDNRFSVYSIDSNLNCNRNICTVNQSNHGCNSPNGTFNTARIGSSQSQSQSQFVSQGLNIWQTNGCDQEEKNRRNLPRMASNVGFGNGCQNNESTCELSSVDALPHCGTQCAQCTHGGTRGFTTSSSSQLQSISSFTPVRPNSVNNCNTCISNNESNESYNNRGGYLW